jgi:hypothetical protein
MKSLNENMPASPKLAFPRGKARKLDVSGLESWRWEAAWRHSKVAAAAGRSVVPRRFAHQQ